MDYKVKILIKKFSYKELVAECNKQGWMIPSAYAVSLMDIPYRTIWVIDEPVRDIDKDNHA